jgi:hypothetical protein
MSVAIPIATDCDGIIAVAEHTICQLRSPFPTAAVPHLLAAPKQEGPSLDPDYASALSFEATCAPVV